MHNNAHILIIDDVVDNIQVAMNILKEDSYNFSFATQGKEALALIDQESDRFDLILLDIMMPGLDGFEVCQKIKENPQTQHIPIIFLTAKVDVESISRGFSLGAVDYISKPFQADELLARVKTHINLYQSRQVLQENNIDLESEIENDYKKFLTELENNQKDLIWMLAELMESTSDETGKHIRRVAELSLLMAKYHPAMNPEEAITLFHASPMHDIGKMTVPHEILVKPGRYTEEEFVAMKKHTSNAYQLLRCSNQKIVKAAAIIAHEHHEKWNGQGYPQQLKGTDIHIFGRIVALVDVFDALTHNRCYKEAWDLAKVVEYIQERRATQFDPELVDILLEHIDEFKEIAKIA